MNRTWSRLLWACWLVWAAATGLAQQGTEGSLLGVVTDSSGAVVPGAEVKVTNLETGRQNTTTSNEAGNFEVFALPRGFYSVTVSVKGFKSWNLERTELKVGERKRVRPVLEVGQISERVTVTSTGAELIQTDESSLKGTVETRQIVELPINGRNPAELVNLVAGMRFLSKGNWEWGNSVTAAGHRGDETEFQVDGLNANSGMDEIGVTIPNVDTIAEFSVQTSSFSAEHGRNPLQMIVVTKSGTNQFHGALWEFLRNDNLDARNTFAAAKPKLARNQFGGSAGGPLLRDRTFFFVNLEATRIRREKIYNSVTIAEPMLRGDFSSVRKSITDPAGGPAFPNNQIPAARFSSASRFFFQHILLPNSPDQRFRGVAPDKQDVREWMIRIDHNFSSNHRLYGRWLNHQFNTLASDYRPEVLSIGDTPQHNVGLNYSWTLNPSTLLSLSSGYVRSVNKFNSNMVGTSNLTQEAGIQGIPTAGREEAVGLPEITFTGYQGITLPWGVPGRLWMETQDHKAGLNTMRGRHTVSFGGEFNNRSTFGRHASRAARGVFAFNGQYTGDGFADYLLGLVQGAQRNYPIHTFGMKDSPYVGLYFQDFFKVTPRLTLNLGARLDYWLKKSHVRGMAVGFDPERGLVVADLNKKGELDLTGQPVAPYLAKATQGLWITAKEAGWPLGLWWPDAVLTPKLGFAWRPARTGDWVIRGGYGIYPHLLVGNRTSSAIDGVVYWSSEAATFSKASNQRWETAFPADPTAFGPQALNVVAKGNHAQSSHEWNVSIQKGLPFQSAVTLSYLGNRTVDAIGAELLNEPKPGEYADIQKARPYPAFARIRAYGNPGRTWYNGLQAKLERRFTDGLLYTLAYSFGRHMRENIESSETELLVPYAPAGYHRGRHAFDLRHVLTVNSVYELPFGRGRKWLGSPHPIVEAVLGQWQWSGIYRFWSGTPLSIFAPGATLGNGQNTRANLVGDPKLAEPTPKKWFNPAAFAAPPRTAWGNSGIGIVEGPGLHLVDFGLMKNFRFTESRYLQVRWEMFNLPNHVNYNNPVTSSGLATTGEITSAKDARQMQLALKFVF